MLIILQGQSDRPRQAHLEVLLRLRWMVGDRDTCCLLVSSAVMSKNRAD
jgi:hypothetical protein